MPYGVSTKGEKTADSNNVTSDTKLLDASSDKAEDNVSAEDDSEEEEVGVVAVDELHLLNEEVSATVP